MEVLMQETKTLSFTNFDEAMYYIKEAKEKGSLEEIVLVNRSEELESGEEMEVWILTIVNNHL